MKYYVCRKMRLMSLLLERGFDVVNARPDRKNPKYMVWIFEDTPKLREAIEDYYNDEKFLNRNI